MSTTADLTPHEAEQLEIFYQRWLGHGTSTERADRPAAEAAITELYVKTLGMPRPEFLWFDSPAAVLDHLRELGLEAVNTFLWGCHDSHWLAYYLYGRDVMDARFDEEDDQELEQWAEIARSCLWWWPFENICFVSERPTVCALNEHGLHRDLGPALDFADGLIQLFALNGVQITNPEHVLTPAEQLDPALVVAIENAQERAELIRKIGANRVLLKLSRETTHGYYLFHAHEKAWLRSVGVDPDRNWTSEVPLEHVRPQPGREPEPGTPRHLHCVTINQALYACAAAGGRANLAGCPRSEAGDRAWEELLDGAAGRPARDLAADFYELHKMASGDEVDPPYLLMVNPSVPGQLLHAERVPMEVASIDDAIRHRNFGERADTVEIDAERGIDWLQQGDVVLLPEEERNVFKPFPQVLT